MDGSGGRCSRDLEIQDLEWMEGCVVDGREADQADSIHQHFQRAQSLVDYGIGGPCEDRKYRYRNCC